MLRLTISFALVAAAAIPSMAQDRTLPAGSYPILNAPTDAVLPYDYRSDASQRLLQGRSDADGRRFFSRREH